MGLQLMWFDGYDPTSRSFMGDLTSLILPGSLQFSTKLHGGFDRCSFVLRIPMALSHQWLSEYHFHHLELVDEAVRLVWEGRVADVKLHPVGVEVLAEGYGVAATRDQNMNLADWLGTQRTDTGYEDPAGNTLLNGTLTNPTNAYANDAAYATFVEGSRLTTTFKNATNNDKISTMLPVITDPANCYSDGGGAGWVMFFDAYDYDTECVYNWYGYDFSEVGATRQISGIRVACDWSSDRDDHEITISARLSGNDGANWSEWKQLYYGNQVIGFRTDYAGGEEDLWGRSWEAADLATDEFIIQLKLEGTPLFTENQTISIDWITAQIYHEPPEEDSVIEYSYWGYVFTGLTTARTVSGIELRVDWYVTDANARNIILQAALSWDAGTTWTSWKTLYEGVRIVGPAQTTDEVGSTTDQWGHDWTNLQTTAGYLRVKFRYEILDWDPAGSILYLDWIAIKVHHIPVPEADVMIEKILTDTCPDISSDQSNIVANGLVVPDDWAHDEYPIDVIAMVCSRGDSSGDAEYLFACWDGRVPFYWKKDTSEVDWRVTRSMVASGGLALGRSDNDIYTRVKTRYTDPDSGSSEALATAWASNTTGPLGAMQRDRVIGVVETSQTTAEMARDLYLAERHKARMAVGVILGTWAANNHGVKRRSWAIRAGDIIEFVDLLPLESAVNLAESGITRVLVKGTSWRDGRMTVIPDIEPERAAVFMSQLEGSMEWLGW